MEGSFDYIRSYYKVPAAEGVRVRYEGREGVITSARGAYIYIKFEDGIRGGPYHPTWNMEYPAPKPEDNS